MKRSGASGGAAPVRRSWTGTRSETSSTLAVGAVPMEEEEVELLGIPFLPERNNGGGGQGRSCENAAALDDDSEEIPFI